MRETSAGLLASKPRPVERLLPVPGSGALVCKEMTADFGDDRPRLSRSKTRAPKLTFLGGIKPEWTFARGRVGGGGGGDPRDVTGYDTSLPLLLNGSRGYPRAILMISSLCVWGAESVKLYSIPERV